MAEHEVPDLEIDLGEDMWILTVEIANLKEQDVNAQVMSPATLTRLTENIKIRKRLESMPYCAQPDYKTKGRSAQVEIVSGHHRVRAARATGIKKVVVLCDRSGLTRSNIIAKQLAHNALTGSSDQDILKTLIARMTSVDDLLESGVSEELLPTPDKFSMTLWTPHAEYRFKTCHFVFLTHQTAELEQLVRSIPPPRDVVCVACQDQFEPFLLAVASYARANKILSAATAVAMLIELANSEVQKLREAGQTEEEVVVASEQSTEPTSAASGSVKTEGPAAVEGSDSPGSPSGPAERSVVPVSGGNVSSGGRGSRQVRGQQTGSGTVASPEGSHLADRGARSTRGRRPTVAAD